MARPRKPTALKVLNGSAKRNPGRINQDEPATAPLRREKLRTPPNMSKAEQTKFLQIVHELPAGVLAECDIDIVQMTARLTVRMETDFDSMTASLMAQLRSCWQQLGMTPSSRSSIRVPQEKDKEKKGKFDGLGNRAPAKAE